MFHRFLLHLSCPAVKRNSLGSDFIFLGKAHPLYDFIQELYRTEATEVTALLLSELQTCVLVGLFGNVVLMYPSTGFTSEDKTLKSPKATLVKGR